MSEDFASNLLKFWMARALEGESQIQEHIQWDVRTKGWMPIAQALGAGLGIAATVLGLALLGWGAARAIDIDLVLMDALLIGVVLLLALGLAVVALRQLFQTSPTVVAAGLGTLVFLLFLAAALMAIFGEIDIQAGIALALAPAVLMAGLALTYRQVVDLLDPFGKMSPVERMLRPYLAQLFVGTQEQANRLTVPYRINGELRAPVSELQGGEPVVRIHRDDLALIEFIREADERGLSRRRWLPKGQPNVILPRSGIEVSRDMYDDFIQRLTAWGIVAPGGEGKSSHWMMNPESAIEIIEREIVAQLVEGQRV